MGLPFLSQTLNKKCLTSLIKGDKIALFLFTRSQYTPARDGADQGDESPSQLWHKQYVAERPTNLFSNFQRSS